MPDFYLTTQADASKCLGQTVFWDEASAFFVFLRKGILEDVVGKHTVINGDYRELGTLPGLRNFENGGEWQKSDPLNNRNSGVTPTNT